MAGQTSETPTSSIDHAIKLYQSKLKDKTKSGSYRIIEMNYENDDDEEKEEENEEKNEQ